MADYVQVFPLGEKIEVLLSAEHEKLLAIGEKMNAACEDAYMNGYNWEAGMYGAYWSLTEENEARAKRFEDIIRALAEDEEALCRMVREHGGEIEWD